MRRTLSFLREIWGIWVWLVEEEASMAVSVFEDAVAFVLVAVELCVVGDEDEDRAVVVVVVEVIEGGMSISGCGEATRCCLLGDDNVDDDVEEGSVDFFVFDRRGATADEEDDDDGNEEELRKLTTWA